MSDRKRVWGRIRRVWATVGFMALMGFSGWSVLAYQATDDARLALVGDDQVEVIRGEAYWSFTPRPAGDTPATGLLFFPGALVEPAAYAPLARAIAGAGFSVILVELPRRGAFGGADGGEVIARARAAMRRLPNVTQWYIAGHSRGGAVAARFVEKDVAGVAGLVLVGTSHPREFSLAHVTVPVMKILGSRDGISEVEKSERNRHLLPATTRWVIIEGANHSQFGCYGFQPGDRSATIGRGRQQELTMRAVVEALESGVQGHMPANE